MAFRTGSGFVLLVPGHTNNPDGREKKKKKKKEKKKNTPCFI